MCAYIRRAINIIIAGHVDNVEYLKWSTIAHKDEECVIVVT